MYRNIVEMSVMTNNDEHIFYTKDIVDENCNFKSRSPFDDPKLVISRPVYKEEIDAGLDTNWSGSTFDENCPDITAALDDFYKLKKHITIYKNVGMELEFILNQAIANNFYDCMSGGCGIYFLSACRWFLENNDIDLKGEVYPASESHPGSGENGWHTFEDFLEEIKNIPRIEEMLGKLPGSKKLLTVGNQ